ncbi:MAG TPA: serine hydrolase domain-containing protein [archaeon]|nr:serine hydrolase domain-containing protein [archaeon]
MKLPGIAIAGFLIVLSCAAPEPPKAERPDRGAFGMLAHHVQSRMKLSADCSAGAALVMLDGRTVYEEYFGKTHRGPDAEPVTALSRFPFYSISKGFGSAVLLSLVTDSIISLDDPVSRYLDYFTGPGPGGKFDRGRVLVRHLASHTSGLPQDSTPPRKYLDQPPFFDLTLDYEPGKSFLYTELGMRVLGQVMEAATGKRYEVLIKERVLDPLGLETVGYLNKGQSTEHIVHTCDGLDSSYVAYSDEFAPKPYPGSGLYGSIRDIARYAQLWLDQGRAGDRVIFKAELRAEAWRTQPPGREPDPDYGLLFWLFPQEEAIVFSGAAHTICAILPEKKMVLVMGLNQRGGHRGWDFEAEKLNLARLGHAVYAQTRE